MAGRRAAAALLFLLHLLPLLKGVYSGAAGGFSLHSLKYFYTGVSEPDRDPPYFIAVGYVDDQLFVRYDSHSKEAQPQASWIQKVTEGDDEYWNRETRTLRGTEQVFRENLRILRHRYNQSAGVHVVQWMSGCDLSGGGYNQYGYDGQDFISFDKETLTWTATDGAASLSKRKLDVDFTNTDRRKAYLEKICPEWLWKYLYYGKETLLRKEPPTVTVTRKEGFNGQEMLICQAHGFYPKEIDATWMKSGENWDHETFRTKIAPNSDGTYHLWISVNVETEERDLYRCHVEHDGLLEPVDVAWEKRGSNVGLIVGLILLGVLAVAILLPTGIFIYKKRRQRHVYKAASGMQQFGRLQLQLQLQQGMSGGCEET